MEILCRLRPVNLVENKCIGIVFSRGDVKRFHTRLRPHQRQVLACGLDKLRAVLRLNFCFDQHDHFFVRHYWTAPLDFHWLADFPPAPPTARAAQMRLRPSALPPSRFAWFSSVIPCAIRLPVIRSESDRTSQIPVPIIVIRRLQ